MFGLGNLNEELENLVRVTALDLEDGICLSSEDIKNKGYKGYNTNKKWNLLKASDWLKENLKDVEYTINKEGKYKGVKATISSNVCKIVINFADRKVEGYLGGYYAEMDFSEDPMRIEKTLIKRLKTNEMG